MAVENKTLNITLNNGTNIPALGFGTYQIKPADTFDSVSKALETGYRSIDTAAMYGNERQVGEAINQSGIDRKDIFVTTKLDNQHHGEAAATKAFEKSLSKLGTDWIDLYLIHWPLPKLNKYIETWTALEKIYRTGSAKAIGVSNFSIAHLEDILEQCELVPSVNQIELHPTFTQSALQKYHREYGIQTEAWSPLGQGGDILQNKTIEQIAENHEADVGQIVLAWHLQTENIAIPKSTSSERIKSNFQSINIKLSEEEIKLITNLGDNNRLGPDPQSFEG